VPERDDEWRYDPPLDYHDPTAGIGGAPPAASALTLRTWLAALTLAGCVAGVVATAVAGGHPAIVVLLAVAGLTALIDLVVIGRRRRTQTR
jgi:Flp pilus assembly protein TadB